jgi:hypothetical protein
VHEHLTDGWRLHGGVSVAGWHESWENERKGYTESHTSYVLAQAMVKD